MKQLIRRQNRIIFLLIFLGVFIIAPGVLALETAWPNSPMGTSLNDDSQLVDFIKYLYEWGISLGGMAAFIALIIAGFQYLTSAGNAMKMKDATGRIKSAGLGLVLLLGSILILNTINPQLTNLEISTEFPDAVITDIEIEEITEPAQKCTEVEILTSGSSKSFGPGTTCASLGRPISSITIHGSCKVELYSQIHDCDNQFLIGTISYIADKDMPGTKTFNVEDLIKHTDQNAYSVTIETIQYYTQ